MSSRNPQPAGPRLAWAARKLAGNALTAGEELLDFEQGHLRRFADDGAGKPVVTQARWLRAVPFARGLAIVTYTRNQLLFLADGFGVNCSLVAVHRAELDAGNRQTFALRRPECPLAMLELEPVSGERSRQFLEGLLAVRDQERRMLPTEQRMLWEKRDQALQQPSLDRLWKAATAPWPRTCAGQWLRALLLNQQELRDRLRLRLNGGKPGWNHDEHFVVGSVCEVAVRKLFPAGPDIREVTAFVTDMRSRIHSTTPPGQHVCEAIIRDAFRDKSVDFTNVSLGEMMHAQVAIAGTAVLNLGLDEAAIDEMIVEGERLAFNDGRHPPLAPAGT
jgi:hypothetical protein